VDTVGVTESPGFLSRRAFFRSVGIDLSRWRVSLVPLPTPVPALPAELVTGAIVLRDRDVLLPLLPKNAVICEVGVGLGSFSRAMIDVCAPQHFIAIDNFRLHELREFWGHPPSHWFGAKTHAGWYRDSFAAEIQSGRMTVIEAESDDALGQLDDASVDIIYIDGDHTYDAVRRDLAMAVRKIRPDGYLVINDYILVDQLGAQTPYGVIYATHEFMIEHNWAMQFFALQTSMFCDVVLRRAGLIPPKDINPSDQTVADASSLRAIEPSPVRPSHVTSQSRVTSHSAAAASPAGLPAEQAESGPPPLDGAITGPTPADFARVEAENAVLKHTVAALRASTSWRITAPLRAAKALIRRGRG